MYLDDVVAAHKRGEVCGVASICSAHPWVIQTAMRQGGKLLIEATCNQVNQFGGYTGMTPPDFVRFVRGIAAQEGFPVEDILFGGDHLGPSVWQNEPAELALQKSHAMLREYVQAGFQKIHLDCSMRLADDPPGALDARVSATRAADLARTAEESRLDGQPAPRYVIGTEVPVPGGATRHKGTLSVTTLEGIRDTLEIAQQAFIHQGLQAAWERVIAVVVQPGVEYGDDFIVDYLPSAAQGLSRFIEDTPMIYEAHSTDYQNPSALSRLVRDHFAILKVGPALTFAYREAVFTLALIENELYPKDQCSNLVQVLDEVMLDHPEHWQKYLHGDAGRLAYSRKFSLSDRMRYYWPDPRVQNALRHMIDNLNHTPISLALWSQFAPELYRQARAGQIKPSADALIFEKVGSVLASYQSACGANPPAGRSHG